MRNLIRPLVTTALALFCFSAFALAGAPPVMNYQGLLTDGSGGPVTTTVTVVFSIYDTEDPGGAAGGGADPLWSETRSVTPDAMGRFDILLGEVDPLTDGVFSGPDRWLGIKVGADDELVPRSRLASTPYGFRVRTIDGATGGDIFGDITLHSTMNVGDLLGEPGLIYVTNGAVITTIIHGQGGSTGGGFFRLRDVDGSNVITTGEAGGSGYLQIHDVAGGNAISLDGSVGHVIIDDPNDSGSVIISSNVFGTKGAEMAMHNFDGFRVVELGAESGGAGAALILRDSSALSVQVKAKSFGGGGEIDVFNRSGFPTIVINGATSANNFGQIQLSGGFPGGIAEINADGTMSLGGTSVPAGYRLAVVGKVICEEVEVQLSADWPDYVFEDSYTLMSLNELENSIKEEGHLPGIPSAEEVEAGGVGLGEMQVKLLLKIEELTLHMIEMKKELNTVHAEKELLESRVSELEASRE